MSRGTRYCGELRGWGRAVYCQRLSHRQSSVSRIIIVEEKPIFSAPFVTTFSPYILSQNVSVETENLSFSHGTISVCTITSMLKITALNAYCLRQKLLHVRTPKISHSVRVVAFLFLQKLD
jgi:hypothetical protein